MGVQGLWHLLQPCARPTKLESLEGKRLAIDSSIWLYHFQMAMRDKEGRTLSNAHILGFLWRILKLVHYGIRPIFVFDGGAPVMKRKTLVGRRQRKTGAKDDHRRIAEKLFNAKLREAAVAHVAGGGGGGEGEGVASSKNADQDENGVDTSESHGLGQNTVYFDDLAGSGSAPTTSKSVFKSNHDDPEWIDSIDDGAVSTNKEEEAEGETEAQKKKKRNDWHKDPYALPALDRDINTVTANNSNAAKTVRGGGKRQDVRFATEGELRALLSSIGPTDLDLDSEFFRSLPPELQYELVGDMRAASRGTSYKRLQTMLSQSPTPIDFSRAQIAGLKTRNELTQKVLEVTDEIGDAHIKVPVRVAGARNREYVLVRNKGDQGGFALGVRDTGTTQEKAIAIDEDTASATTGDDDLERRTTDEEVDLVEVPIEASPDKKKSVINSELLKVNPNDPTERKRVTEELLQRRAKAMAKEKKKERGIVDETEEMEEQLNKSRDAKILSRQERSIVGGSDHSGSLFLRGARPKAKEAEMNSDEINEDDDDDDDADEWGVLLNQHQVADLGKALDESERSETPKEIGEGDETEEFDLEEVSTHAFEATDYSQFYADGSPKRKKGNYSSRRKTPTKPAWVTASAQNRNLSTTKSPAKSTTGGSALSFQFEDREGVPESLDDKLLAERHWEGHDDDKNFDEGNDRNSSTSSTINSPELIAAQFKAKNTAGWGDHSRVISISDSDVSREDVKEKERKKRKEDQETVNDPNVTVRMEQNNMRDAGGEEIKIVDFQDKPVKQIIKTGEAAQIISTTSPSLQQSKLPYHSPSASTSPKTNADKNGAGLDASLYEKSASSIDSESAKVDQYSSVPPSPSPIPNSVEEENDDDDDDDDDDNDNLSLARRAEERLPSSEVQATKEMLEKETDEEVVFDNDVSLLDGAGLLPPLDSDEEERILQYGEGSSILDKDEDADIGRQSEEEHSDYSNRGFGKGGSDSESDQESEVILGPDGFPLPTAEEFAAMDAEDEAELGEIANDQDEFVSFLSRAKGQGLNQIRREVEDEVNKLRSEHATTRRTEGEVTIQMAKEIQFMLRLFGLPYITAPMEAEAQCAELLALKLADGIITDDSDVFLFGGTFIYKNMFNNKKYVECYKLSDLQHDLGMDRTKLVQLAYLLGSDYTEGLEGVGPVLAMEILSHFPGNDGLVKFREWWIKVQMGRDTVKDTYDSTLKRLKKTLRNKVHLEHHWPDPNVIDAYFEPIVDDSKEPFQWGLPDLDSLRSFFREYLRWDQEKTDHYLVPAIEAQNRRSKRQGTQSTLDRANFFDLSAGEGIFAARQKPAYGSSRLQQVIKNFRASNATSNEKLNGKKGGAHQKKKHAKGDNGNKAIDIVNLSEETEETDEGNTVNEATLGKEMAKKSRPVVRRNIQKSKRVGNDAEDVELGSGGKRKKILKGEKSQQGRKRKASHSNVHDEEWIPAKSKRQSRKKKTVEVLSGGTSLSQARNMSLDHVNSLPASRTGHRVPSRELSRTPMILSSEGEESSLTEQE